MDKATTSFERIAYARRFIQIYANKPLPNAVCLETEGKVNIEVEYDWIPPTCKKCKYFGHVDIHCPTKMSWVPKTHTNEEVKQNQNEGKEKESGVSEEEEKEITNLNKGELESKTSGNPTKEISANANVATVTSAGDTGLKKGNGNYVNSVSEFVPQVEGVVVRASKCQIKTQSSGSGEQIHVADMHADIQTDTLIQKHADADTQIKDQTTNTKHSSQMSDTHADTAGIEIHITDEDESDKEEEVTKPSIPIAVENPEWQMEMETLKARKLQKEREEILNKGRGEVRDYIKAPNPSIMINLVWNVRGLNLKERRRDVIDHIKKLNPSIVGLVETKVMEHKSHRVQKCLPHGW